MRKAATTVADQGASLCVDASVGVKWMFGHEEGSAASLALLERYVAGDIRITVPDLFLHEVGNALMLAVRRKGVTEAAALEALAALVNFHLAVVPIGPLATSALTLGLRLGLSFYDAAYLAVAEDHGIPLITADKRLLATDLPWILGLDDVQPYLDLGSS